MVFKLATVLCEELLQFGRIHKVSPINTSVEVNRSVELLPTLLNDIGTAALASISARSSCKMHDERLPSASLENGCVAPELLRTGLRI
jgi:hypothetical protein